MWIAAIGAMAVSLLIPSAFAQTSWPNQREGDFILKDYRFESGEILPELRLHYTTLGAARRDATGGIVNGVLLLHGTGGTGKQWLMPSLANELFGEGQPLDASRFFIILPDGVGRGGSSRPSDGLRGKFPHYRYHDIVASEHRVLTEGIGVKHLRLVLGSSMGGMHTWMWGEMYPDLMDGLVPLASQPIAFSGRNWMTRRMLIDAIRNDPDWKGGDYDRNPSHFVYTAPLRALMTESVIQLQASAPTREAGDAFYEKLVEQARKTDANNLLYATEAVMDYDPSKDLEKIKAKLMAINFADDAVNPPELDVVEAAIRRIRDAKLVIVPASAETHGHFTHFRAAFWKSHLAAFMKTLPPEM
jgi:homoserine O-acetyltransferase/O-succinyltransferase